MNNNPSSLRLIYMWLVNTCRANRFFMIWQFFHASFTGRIYHEILPGKTDRLNCALEVDSGFLLWVTRVREVDLSTSPLHDMFDVAAVSTHHKEMMLRCDVELCAHRDCRGQAPSQVLQQHGCSFLGGNGRNQWNKTHERRSQIASLLVMCSIGKIRKHCWV